MKYIIGVLSVVIVGVAGFFGLKLKNADANFGLVANYEIHNQASDVVGTHSGTSTVGSAFGGDTAATSSYISRIGKNKEFANYQVILTAVTSSADAWLTFYIEGSTDDYCWVTSSTAPDVSTGDINWFPVMDNLKDKVHSTSLTSASSSLVWATPTVNTSANIVLENLNYECLKLWVGGQSSTPYIGLATK